jgi:hypothetical protein
MSFNSPSGKNLLTAENLKIGRDYIFYLIQKYIKIRAPIQKEIDDFVATQFGDAFVLGVQYRGTDKVSEAPRVSYERVMEEIKNQIKGKKNFKIFVATDETALLAEVKKTYPNKVLSQDATRSSDGKPVHFSGHDGFKIGKEALIDCLLLSKTHFLIRTSSNLSLWATYFNPELSQIELSQRY